MSSMMAMMNHSHHMMNSSNMMPTNSTMSMMHHHHDHSNTTMDPHHHHTSGSGSHDGNHSGHEGHDGHSTAEHSMQMYFHTGLSEYILFEGLLTNSVGGLVGACIAMFVLSVAYEGLKYFREYLLRNAHTEEVYSPSVADGVTVKQPEVGSRMLSRSHTLQTFLHMVQVFVSYCLMLVFMTYNVYLCIAIVLGAGLGYFIFGWRRAMVIDMNEHCH